MAKQLNVSVAVTADTEQAKAKLKELENNLTRLSGNSANLKIGINTNDLQKASAAAAELAVHLKSATNQNTGTLDFTKLNTSIKASGSTLTEYGNQLLKLGPQGQQAFTQLSQAVATSEIPVKRLTGLFGELGTVLKNTIRWQISSSLIHGFMGSISQAFNYAQNLNESLNRIQIVTQASAEHMAQFAEQANKAAKQLNTTTTAYTDASLIYYQQGLNDKQVAERTAVTIKMANAAGVSAQKVSDQMTAVWNNFADGSKSLEYYADVMTALGAATASSTDEISQGLEKFASVADTVGLSYENAAAALATITATTRQSADSVGTGLRTLFSRLQSVSLGETLDDGVTLTKYTKALETIGVNALDAGGNLREMDDILEDMGSKWDVLTQAQKVAVAQTVGGVRQYTTLISLMDNFDFYKQNQQVALNSEGTVQKQADIYAKSWEGSQKRVRAATEAIYSDLINDEFFISLNDTLAKALNILDGFIDALGGIRTILPAIAALMTKAFGSSISAGLVKFGTNAKMLFTSPTKMAADREAFLKGAAQQMAGVYGDENKLSPVQANQLQYAQTQLRLQQQYAAASMSMTKQQQDVAKIHLDQYNAGRNAYDMQAMRARTSARQATDTRSSLVSQANLGQAVSMQKLLQRAKNGQFNYANGTAEEQQLWKLMQQNMSKFGITGALGDNGKASSATSMNSDEFLTNLGKGLDELGQKLSNFEKQKDIIANWADTSEQSVENLKKELIEVGNMSEDEAKQITENLTIGSQEDIDELYKNFSENNTKESQQAVTDFAQQWGFTTDQVEQYRTAIIAATGDETKLAAIAKQIEQSEKNAANAVKAKSSAMQIAQKITDVAGGLMAMTSAASAASATVDNLFDIIDKGKISLDGVLGTFSSFASMAAMGVNTFAQLSGVIGPIAAAVVAIGSIVIPAAINVFDQLHESEAEKIERLAEEADKAQTAASNASVAYDTLIENKTRHNQLLEELQQMTAATDEFKNALTEANAIANDIIKTNNLIYGKDYRYDGSTIKFEDGVLEGLESEQLNYKNRQAMVAQISDWQSVYASESATKNKQLSDNASEVSKGIIENDQLKDFYGALQWYLFNNGNEAFANDLNNFMLNELTSEEASAFRLALDPSSATSYQDYISRIQGLSKDYALQYAEAGQDYYYSTPTIEAAVRQAMAAASADTGLALTQLPQLLNEQLAPNKATTEGLNRQASLIGQSQYTQLLSTLAYTNNTIDRDTVVTDAENLAAEFLSQRYNSTEVQDRLNEVLKSEKLTNLENNKKDWKDDWEKLNNLLRDENGELQEQWADYAIDSFINSEDFKSIENNKEKAQALYDYLAKNLQIDEVEEMLNETIENFPHASDIIKALTEDVSNQSYNDLAENYKKNITDALDLTEAEDEYVDEQIQQLLDSIQAKGQTTLDKIFGTESENGQTISKQLFENFKDITSKEWAQLDLTSGLIDLFKTKDNNFDSIISQALFGDDPTGASLNRDILNRLSAIDTSSTLSALFGVKTLADQMPEIYGEIYDQALKGAGGESGVFSSIFGTEDFQKELKKVQKEFNKTGKVSAKSIEEIADSCESLGDALDSNILSAGAIADAIELYSSGAVSSIDKISNELWKALEAANELQAVLSQGFNYVDEFNPDRSVSDIADTYIKWGKEFKQALEDGLTGDNRTYQIAEFLVNKDFAENLRKYFFGLEGDYADKPGERTANWEAQYKDYLDMLDAMDKAGNFNPWWDFMLNKKGDNFYGLGKDYYGNVANPSDALASWGFSMGANGDVELAVEQGKTSKDYVDAIVKATGMSEDAASAIFGEIVGHGEGIAGLLQANEFIAGFKEASAGSDEDLDYFLKSQANNLNYDILLESLRQLGYDIDKNTEVKEALSALQQAQKDAKEEQDNIDKAFSESAESEKRTPEQIAKDRAKAIGAVLEGRNLVDEKGNLNFSRSKDTLNGFNLTDSESIEGLANYIDSVEGTDQAVSKITGTYTDATGAVREFTASLSDLEGENTEEQLKNFNKQLEEMSKDASTANKSFAKDFFQGIIEAINELDPAELDSKIQPIIQLINDLATAFAQLDGSKESITALGNAMNGLVALGGISSNGGSADLVQTIGDIIVKLQEFNGTDLNINISVLPKPSIGEIDHLTDDFRDMQGMSKIEISIEVVDDASVQQFKGDKHGLEEAFNALQQAAQISIKLVGLNELSDQIQEAVDAINDSNPTINVSLSANGQKKKEEEKPVEYPEGKELRTGANVVRRIGDSDSYIIDGEKYNLDGTAIAKEFTSMFNNLFAAQTILNNPEHSQQSEEQAVAAILEYSKSFAGLIGDIKSGTQGKSESQASAETSSTKENSVNLIGKVTELDVSAVENQSIKVKASINSEPSESSSQVTPEINTDEVAQEAAEVATTISSANITMEIGATGEEAKAEGDQAASYINSLKASISVGTNTSVDEADQKIHSLDNTTITLNVTVNASALGAAVRAAAAGTSAVRAMAFHKMKCTHSDCSGTCGEQFTQCANGVTSGSVCHWNNNGVGSSGATGGKVKSYVNGSPNHFVSPGPALTGEEGAEIVWNKQQGYAYIVGANHPQFVNLQPGDRIFNANDTRKILNYDKPKSNYVSSILDPSVANGAIVNSYAETSNAMTGDSRYAPKSTSNAMAGDPRYRAPAKSAYNGDGGSGGGDGGGGDGPAAAEEKPWKPERYHLLTRQIKDLTALYEELSKAKEHAYGVNILKAIDKEIDAKEKLLNKNRELLAQAEDYLDEDRGTLDALGIPADFDENGNLANYDELQEMYKKVLDTTDDEEQKKAAEEAWNAITQYEETLDKIQETKAEITDTIYDLSDLALERVTTKAEIRVDFDEREIKFIQHFIDKLDDDITKTSQVLDKVTQQMGLINDKINTTRTAIDEVFASMTNSKGEKINVTYDQWLKMTDAEREALDINGDYGKQLEEYSDDILEYIEALEDYKTRGVEELSTAFDELNEKVTSQIDLFSHYNSLLSSLKDLADLQGLRLPDSYRQAVNKLNQSMVQVTKNNIQAQQGYYAELQDEANKLQQKINETSDFDLKKAYQEQLDDMQSMMRDTAEDILSLWQEGLQKARDIFDQEIDFLKQDYEAGFSDLYNTADLLQGAYDRKKELNEQYVDDYEKYYQLGKLQRQINKDLDQAAVNGNKQNKNLKALLEEIQKLQKDGSELSAYDLDILAKKYEYEKALADLEDARNAKQIVRLQRDRNGNWGYVYTAADGDELAEQEQAVEDKLYEYTKAATEQSKDLQSQILSLWAEAGNKIAEMRAAGVSNDVIDDYIADTQAKLDFLMSQLEKTGTDVSLALPKWIAITNDSFNLTTDTFTETILSLVTGMETIVETSDTISNSILKIAQASKEAADAYNNSVASLNQLAQGNGMDFMKNAQAWADTIAAASYKNVENTKTAITEMSSLYDQILDKAKAFEREFMKTYEPIIERNEKFLQDLIGSLSELNKNHHALPAPAPAPVQEQPKQEDNFPWWRYGGSSMMFMSGGKAGYGGPIGMPVGFDTGGFTGTWGPDGRLAFLHEKENVFDQDDTVNLLKAANILKTLDMQTGIFEKGLGNFINPNVKDNKQTLEQEVYITAEFPNATSHSEIEEAFDNLVNRATQYANRKVG